MKWLKRLMGSAGSDVPAVEEAAVESTGSAAPKRRPDPNVSLEVDPRGVISGSEVSRAIILDCRENYEWGMLRIPGSMHIPMAEIPDRLSELPTAGEVLVVCAHGVRSLMVAQYLQGVGIPARSLRGGLEFWQRLGGAVER